MKNDLIWSKLKQRKQEKDFMKIDNLKKETKCFVHQGLRKLKGQQNLYHFFLNEKTKEPNMKDMKDLILFAKY